MLSRASQSHHHLSSIALPSPVLRRSLNLLPTIPFLHFSSPPSYPLQSFNIFTSSTSSSTILSPARVFSRNSNIPSSSIISLRSLSSCFSSQPRAAFTTGTSSGGGREILVQHLLVKEDDLNLLLELQKRAAGGEDLSNLAVEYSICPSKEEGGLLGWVRKGQMVPEFEEAAFSAPLEKVVRCKTKFGWHLLQVLSEREELLLQEIQPNELHERLQDPGFVEDVQLIDVREPEEVARASLPGFQVLPLQQFGSWGPEITTKFDPDKDTYVMCHHGMRSLQVAKWLQTQGFKRVLNVAGGIHAYAITADPSIPTY